MDLRIEEIGADRISEYAQVPIRFKVRSIFVVEEADKGLGGLELREVKVDKPYVKDYDAEGGPERWLRHFDITNWGFFVTYDGDRPVAGATIAYNTEGVNMLEGRDDLAVLWDIRVHSDYQGKGIGAMLLGKTVEWARSKGCSQLKIETQNVNVPACRFYARQGCHLGQIHRYAYYSPWAEPEVRDEVMLNWYLDL
ncbi:GNAT family N-acetyltransferase [candidate division WOR-3 bacterium]|nr:GNAT family N-acetyltransferase [candidate division WOR-3 bacterium]